MSRSSSDRIKPQASSHCPSAGSSNAPSLGSAAADDWPKTGNVSTTRPSPSCASPPSASCCENYAIPHDVLGQTLRNFETSLRDGGSLERGLVLRPPSHAALSHSGTNRMKILVVEDDAETAAFVARGLKD